MNLSHILTRISEGGIIYSCQRGLKLVPKIFIFNKELRFTKFKFCDDPLVCNNCTQRPKVGNFHL